MHVDTDFVVSFGVRNSLLKLVQAF